MKLSCVAIVLYRFLRIRLCCMLHLTVVGIGIGYATSMISIDTTTSTFVATSLIATDRVCCCCVVEVVAVADRCCYFVVGHVFFVHDYMSFASVVICAFVVVVDGVAHFY